MNARFCGILLFYLAHDQGERMKGSHGDRIAAFSRENAFTWNLKRDQANLRIQKLPIKNSHLPFAFSSLIALDNTQTLPQSLSIDNNRASIQRHIQRPRKNRFTGIPPTMVRPSLHRHIPFLHQPLLSIL